MRRVTLGILIVLAVVATGLWATSEATVVEPTSFVELDLDTCLDNAGSSIMEQYACWLTFCSCYDQPIDPEIESCGNCSNQCEENGLPCE